MHYYKFNIADWHLHTAHLTLVEEILYFKLINYYYETEKPIENDKIQSVIRRLRLGSESETVSLILEEFFVIKDGKWFHHRCEKEIKEFKKKTKQNKENGKKGGRPKKNQHVIDNPEKTQMVSEKNPDITLTTNHKPLTTNQELLKDNSADLESAFDIFWQAGMVKTNKAGSFKKFKTKCKGKNPIEFANMLAKDIKTRLRAEQFGFSTLHPSTYLNNERWNDDLPKVKGINYVGGAGDFDCKPEGFE